MRDAVYIVCDHRGARRMTKRKPDLYMGEICFRLKIVIPDEHFYRDIPVVECEVPSDLIVTPDPEIEVEEHVEETQ